MRDYVLWQSEHRPNTVGLALLWVAMRNWHSRRTFARLARLSDYQLRDIGLSHADVLRLSVLPLLVDPVWEADRLRLINSRRKD